MTLPDSLLQSLSRPALESLAKKYIQERKYEELRHLNKVATNSERVALGVDSAIQLLDKQAMSIIVSTIKTGELSLNPWIDAWINNVAIISQEDIIGTQAMALSKEERIEIQGQIIEDFVSLKIRNIHECNEQNNQNNETDREIKIDKESLGIGLGVLAQFLTMDAFNKYLDDHTIDPATFNLTDYEIAHIPALLFKDAKPVIDSIPNQTDAITILLARTYTKELGKEGILSIYNNLSTCNITKKLIDYIATEIIKGDALKIIFSSGLSGYHSNSHVVSIDTHSQCSGTTLESTIAHELSHWAMDKIFSNEGLPVSYKNLYHSTLDLTKLNIPYSNGVKIDNIPIIFKELQSLAEVSINYQKASLPLLEYATKLISVNPEAIESFKTVSEMIEYLTHSTIIPIFYLNSYNQFTEGKEQQLEEEIKTNSEIQGAVIKLIDELSSQRNYHQNCNSDIKTELNYILQDYLPQLISDRQLTEEQVFFLERMADIIFRSSKDRNTEFVVRYPEFAITEHMQNGSDPEIKESFKGMQQFWEKNIVPQFDETIQAQRSINIPEGLEEQSIAIDLVGKEGTILYITDLG